MRPPDATPIADHALIGDRRTSALVSAAGSIDWCCLPRFDSRSTFAALLDAERGGRCQIEPTGGGPWQRERRYRGDTLVLETNISSRAVELRLIDCFLIDDRRSAVDSRQILRVIEGTRGESELRVTVAPRFDYGAVRPWIRRHGNGVYSATGGADAIVVRFDGELVEDPEHELTGTGRRFTCIRRWHSPGSSTSSISTTTPGSSACCSTGSATRSTERSNPTSTVPATDWN